MAGDDDLVDIGAARAGDDARREGVEARRHAGAPAQHVVAGENPVREPLPDAPALARPPHQQGEYQHGERRADDAAEHEGEPGGQRTDGGHDGDGDQPADSDRGDGEQDHVEERHQEEHPVAPVRGEIAQGRAGGEEIRERHGAVPHAAGGRPLQLGAARCRSSRAARTRCGPPSPGAGVVTAQWPSSAASLCNAETPRRHVPGRGEPGRLPHESTVLGGDVIRIESGHVKESSACEPSPGDLRCRGRKFVYPGLTDPARSDSPRIVPYGALRAARGGMLGVTAEPPRDGRPTPPADRN